MPAKRAHALMAGFFVRMGQVEGIVDYSKMPKAQLSREIAALQEKVAELEHAESECGAGSIFTCTLPLRESAGLTPVADDPLKEMGNAKNDQ